MLCLFINVKVKGPKLFIVGHSFKKLEPILGGHGVRIDRIGTTSWKRKKKTGALSQIDVMLNAL